MGITELDGTVHTLTSRGLSQSTNSSYNSGVISYTAFCYSYNLTPFPLQEQNLCHFVTFLFHSGLSYSCIRLYLSGLRYQQLLDGGNDPSLASLHRLHYMLRGCRRSVPDSTRKKCLPITPAVLRLLHQAWSSHATEYDIICMWAACCTAFFGFLCSAEFTCSSWSSYNPSMHSVQDVTVDSQSNPMVVHLTLRQSKTDVFGAGVTLHLGRTWDILCPVSALLAYLAIRPSTPGSLFVKSTGEPLSRTTLIMSIRHTLTDAGLDVSRINGHSFRIGAATTAAQAGISDSTIKSLGRWRSGAFTRYLQPPVRTIAEKSRYLLQLQT